MSQFGVPDSALGHPYQHRYALLLLLRAVRELGPTVELSIERADDIALEQAGAKVALVQTKHKSKRTLAVQEAALGDASVDLWKTLRVWSVALADGSLKLPGTVLSLVATGTASDGAAASYLRPEGRNVASALALLRNIAATSKSQENTKAYADFRKLRTDQQELLLEHVRVLDGSPTIGDVQPQVERELVLSVEQKHVGTFFSRLEGWWVRRVIAHLEAPEDDRILGVEVLQAVEDLRRQFQPDTLPIDDLSDIVVPSADDEARRAFVVQLQLVGLTHRMVTLAIQDYYKAIAQRSRWVRDDLLFDDKELERYQRKLIEAWEHAFELMRADCAASAVEELKKKAGRELFAELTQRRDIPIRRGCDAPFVMRGSFHILADDCKVGWHRDFIDRLRELLDPSGGNT